MESRLDVLLVDDNSGDVMLFQRAVKKSGLAIFLEALSAGHQAVAYLEAKGAYANRLVYPLPDIIVLDLKMPGFNGFDLLAWRKASTLFQAIPVVIFTGLAADEDIKRVFELGANKHITKPGVPEDWERIVREIYDFATEGTSFFRAEDATNTSDNSTQPVLPPQALRARWGRGSTS